MGIVPSHHSAWAGAISDCFSGDAKPSRWASRYGVDRPGVVVCDNDLEEGWSRDRENDGNTGNTRIFK
jgi:hypothetical protein